MSSPAPSAPTPEKIMRYAWGYAPPLILEAAVRTRVFDVLNDGPKTVAETSDATGASERGLTAIMNALVGLEFLTRDEAGRFSLTPESATFLVSSKPAYFGGMLAHASKQLIPDWLDLTTVVETGKPVKAVNREFRGRRVLRAVRRQSVCHELRIGPSPRRRRSGSLPPRNRSRCWIWRRGVGRVRNRHRATISARHRHGG